jgi:hypothetical protein
LMMMMCMILDLHTRVASKCRPSETNRQWGVIACHASHVIRHTLHVTSHACRLTAASAAVDGQRRVTVARAIAAYASFASPPCSCNMQREGKALARIDNYPGAVFRYGGAERECHGARSSHAQAGGDGQAAALGLRLRDVTEEESHVNTQSEYI